MDYLSSGNRYAYLSLTDLLTAREQFHAHLVHKRHVIGTAVGRYLIRKGDPLPGESAAERTGPKPPRTIEDSEIRDYSWPCVLVFVDDWVDESEFGRGELAQSDYVPKTIYMPDGKAVPICLVLAPRVMTPPRRRPAPEFDPDHLQGGHPVVSTVQNATYRGTIGCLLTDGHKVYALTARHVAGPAGQAVGSIGTSSALQLSRVPFESVYAPWPGKHAFVNLDVALVEIDDITKWSSGIESIGPIGPLAALSTYNLSLNLIGCPVRAYGAASGLLTGRISALFYRYKAVGGFDYVADFLIGSRSTSMMRTLPGDSGTTWVVDGDDENRNLPIAVQWGGTVLGTGTELSFALASNLSTICRELNVDVYRGPDVAAFEYWGEDGHRKIGQLATDLVENAKLKSFLKKNTINIGVLANVPDKMWKDGSRPNEGPNHYADVDLGRGNVKTLNELTPDADAIDPDVWRDYYRDINAHPEIDGKLSEGLLPFRISQIFKKVVGFVRDGKTEEVIAGMGVLAHYVGDACQPLHSTYLTHGDPFRKPKSEGGTPVTKMLGLGKGYGGKGVNKGVHSAYETHMISANVDELESRVLAKFEALGNAHGLGRVGTGRKAAWRGIELMNEARSILDPMELVEFYADGPNDADAMNEKLWNRFGERTVHTMVEGCRVLAMLWDSIWEEGSGDDIDDAELNGKPSAEIRTICRSTGFLRSLSMAEVRLSHLD